MLQNSSYCSKNQCQNYLISLTSPATAQEGNKPLERHFKFTRIRDQTLRRRQICLLFSEFPKAKELYWLPKISELSQRTKKVQSKLALHRLIREGVGTRVGACLYKATGLTEKPSSVAIIPLSTGTIDSKTFKQSNKISSYETELR